MCTPNVFRFGALGSQWAGGDYGPLGLQKIDKPATAQPIQPAPAPGAPAQQAGSPLAAVPSLVPPTTPQNSRYDPYNSDPYSQPGSGSIRVVGDDRGVR